MNAIWNFVVAHQVLCTLAAGYVWSAFISALPAPQSNSSMFYNFSFKFLNVLAANIARAQNSSVERSPNFQAAMNFVNAQAPSDKPVIVVDPSKPGA